jgi:hypothetical protein
MVRTLTFARVGRFRALWLLALGFGFSACNATDQLTGNSDEPAAPSNPVTPPSDPSFAMSFAGGIPMGTYAQPTSTFGYRYNGGLRNIWPSYLRSELAAIKARGGRVVLTFSGNERYYKTNGHFDLGKWKARVARFKGIDFSSYVRDGTIIAHYLIDEPNDKTNWGGTPVSPSTVEAMAQYSKQLWPNLPTVARAEPGYLKGGHRYLDAAWAQYVTRKGTAADYLRRNVSDAQRYGLALVVGLNIRKGGPGGRSMTPSEVANWGSTMLNSSYPCAFVSWQWYSAMTTSAMSKSMDLLRRKAQSRAQKSCR